MMVGNLIGKYKIIRLIGEGGMASVYEAEHEMLGAKVAVKVLNPILSANTQIRDRFKNEAKMMASFNHPNITKIIDFDDQPHHLSIVMEFLEGEDLNDKIKRNGALPEKEVFALFQQILSAFQYAHEKGIVHRDIKPSNIFILPDGQVKILDFGIAKLFGQGNEMTQTGTQMGTPIYMSPEQVKADKSIDHRSDIYSLGVTMFYALHGKPPYNSDADSQFDIFNKIVYEPLPELNIPGDFNKLITKACNKNREERFQSCDQWLEAINQNDLIGLRGANLTQNKLAVDSLDRTVVATDFNNSRDYFTRIYSLLEDEVKCQINWDVSDFSWIKDNDIDSLICFEINRQQFTLGEYPDFGYCIIIQHPSEKDSLLMASVFDHTKSYFINDLELSSHLKQFIFELCDINLAAYGFSKIATSDIELHNIFKGLLIENQIKEDYKFYLNKGIPEKKKFNFLDRIKLAYSDIDFGEVILLYDDTVFGKCDDGMAIILSGGKLSLIVCEGRDTIITTINYNSPFLPRLKGFKTSNSRFSNTLLLEFYESNPFSISCGVKHSVNNIDMFMNELISKCN